MFFFKAVGGPGACCQVPVGIKRVFQDTCYDSLC